MKIEWLVTHVQCYHALSDICCPGNSRYGLPWCQVLKGEQFLGASVGITNTSRVADQVHALTCTVSGSKPWLRPVRFQEVRSWLLFWSFSLFLFSFDSLGAATKKSCPVLHSVWFSVGPICRGTTVTAAWSPYRGKHACFGVILAGCFLVNLRHFCGRGSTLWCKKTLLSPENFT